MQTPNILPPGQSGNSPRGTNAALPDNRFQTLHAALLALADGYTGHGRMDTLRLASQVARKLARAGVR
jgi:hypothetical protein